jgi:3-mercaptopropionate dioxygenase
MSSTPTVVDPLIDRLRAAARLEDVPSIAQQIKSDLESFIPAEGLRLPERYRTVRPDSYARRLFYRDPELGFTALIMTWAPGQRTPIHDHSGIWCVEGVLEGAMEVTRYELVEQREDGVCQFLDHGTTQATAGSAGALIPPFEHHVLANALADRPSLTLHVYGGEMDRCSVFEPQGDGGWRRRVKDLTYDD